MADVWLSFRGLNLVKILKLKLDILVIRLKSNYFGESTDPWLWCAFHNSVRPHSVKHHISQWMLPLKHGFGSKQIYRKISPPKDRQCWRFHFRSPQTPKLDQKNNQHTFPILSKSFNGISSFKSCLLTNQPNVFIYKKVFDMKTTAKIPSEMEVAPLYTT